MKKIICLGIACLALLLSGCIPNYQYDYTYYPPATYGGKQCVKQCGKARSSCDQSCKMSYHLCEVNARTDYNYQFKDYKLLKQSINNEVQQLPFDTYNFTNNAVCTQSCGCRREFNICYRNCGGTVIVHRKCVANCFYNL